MPVVKNSIILDNSDPEINNDSCKNISNVEDWSNDQESSSSEDEVRAEADEEM